MDYGRKKLGILRDPEVKYPKSWIKFLYYEIYIIKSAIGKWKNLKKYFKISTLIPESRFEKSEFCGIRKLNKSISNSCITKKSKFRKWKRPRIMSRMSYKILKSGSEKKSGIFLNPEVSLKQSETMGNRRKM